MLVGCGDPPAGAQHRTLALYGAKLEAHCAPGGAIAWKIQRRAGTDRRGFRQAVKSRCVLRPPLPEETRLHFRVAVVSPSRSNRRRDLNRAPKPGSQLLVRVSTAESASGEPATLFEEILTAEAASHQGSVGLPAGAREIRLEALRIAHDAPTRVAAEWTDLHLQTRSETELDPTLWSIPIGAALDDFYSAEGWVPASPRAKRILIIGIDGASWPLLDELIEGGKLPTLARCRAAGYSGVLESSVIPESAMGWGTLRTGVNAGRHGVFGFEFADQSTPAYWRLAGAYGLLSVVVGVPDAPLRRPFEGVFVGGWTYGAFEDFVEPRKLRRALYRARYTPSLTKLRNADYYNLRTRSRTDLTISLLGRLPWDHAFVVYEYGDAAGHRLGLRSAGWVASFEEIDAQIGRLLDQVGPQTTVLIVSDHGWKDYRGAIALGPWLGNNGFSGWKVSMWAGSRLGIEPATQLPPRARQMQRKRLVAALEALRESPDGPRLIEDIILGEEAFSGPHATADRGLLIVELANGFRAASSEQGELVKRHAFEHHSSDGIYLLIGPDIPPGAGPISSILDVAPTVLGFLGIPLPPALEGRPLFDFGPPRLDALPAEAWRMDLEATSKATEPVPEHLEESLRALGYIQ